MTMRCFWALVLWIGFPVSTQDSADIDVTLTRGTTGLGIQLISETRGRGAVVDGVIPDSAASLVLRVGDVLTTIAGVEIKDWSLDNIYRLLEIPGRIKLRIRRRPEPRFDVTSFRTAESEEIGGDQSAARTISCYASIEGDTRELHAFECSLAPYGADLPPFSGAVGQTFALPVVIAQPLEHCEEPSLPSTLGDGGAPFALLVSKGGCLPGVKARNAAWNRADLMILVDGQFPPLPPLPTATGGRQAMIFPGFISAHSPPKKVDIPVVAISNSTGQRMISQVLDHGQRVMILAHAGGRPARSAPRPRNQIPVGESRGLDINDEAFHLKSSFRDGRFVLNFGHPGLPSGATPTIYLQVVCELSHLLTGTTKRISFDRTVLCPACNGRGAPAADMRPCKSCGATGHPGISKAGHDHSREVEQTLRTTCDRCRGFGEVAKKGKTCSRCKGERVITERASLDLVIPKGAPDRHKLYFKDVGSHLPGRTAGDVEVVLKTQPHESFERDGANLRTEINITLTEALSGFTRNIHLLNGSFVALNKTGMTNNYGEVEIEGGGLPVYDPSGTQYSARDPNAATTSLPKTGEEGSLIITCNVVFPENFGGGGRLDDKEYAAGTDAGW